MSVKLNRLAALAIAGCVTLGVASNAHADRRSSLNGNLLITDQDDVYFYPQLSLDYRNLVSFDYYPGSSLNGLLGTNAPPQGLGGRDESSGLVAGSQSMGGGGLLLFGHEDFAFGISSHREDVFGATVGSFLGAGDLHTYGAARNRAWGYFGYNSPVPAPISGTPGAGATGTPTDFIEPLQMLDLIAAFRLAPEHSLGFRLSVGQNSASEERNFVNNRTDKDSWNTTAINLVAGYSMKSDFQLDLNLELGLHFFSNDFVTTQNNVPNYEDSASMLPSFTVSSRAMIPMQENIELGVLGVIHVNSSGLTDEFSQSPQSSTTPLDRTDSAVNFLIEVGAGPVYKLPDSTTVSAYGTLGFGYSSFNFDSSEVEVSSTGVLLPGFKLALEHWLWEWMAFRTGLSTRYYFQSQSRTYSNDAQPNIAGSASYYEFLWSVGLGFKLGNFELSGTLQTPFVTDGPAVLGGTSPGLFSLLNASYKF